MVTFGERIKALAVSLGKEDQMVASDLGLSKAQMSHYTTGKRKVPSELLQRIVDTYNINPQFLFKEDAPLYNEKKISFPSNESEYPHYLTLISAGIPFEVDGITKNEVKKISIPDVIMGKWAGNKDVFVTHIFGESMNKVMPDKTMIAVKHVELGELRNGDIVVFSYNEEYGVKRFYQQDSDLIFRPDSTDLRFGEQRINIDDAEGLHIHGKVVLYIVEQD